MSNLRHLLKRAGMSGEQLAEAIGVNTRTISHHFNTGRMPFVIVWKIHKATKIPLNELIPKHLAEYWESLFDESAATNKPRGRKEGWRAEMSGEAPGATPEPSLREKVVMREYPHTKDDLVPPDLTAPRETSKPQKSPKEGEKKATPESASVPRTAETAMNESEEIVGAVTKTQKKKSVADIMKEAKNAPQPEAEGDGPAPDFSKVPDHLFETSMDPAQQPRFRK